MSDEKRIILLVEDEADDQLLLRHALKLDAADWQMVTVSDGAQALEYLLGDQTHVNEIALVLLDLKLPKMSGLEVLEKLRADPRTKYVPVAIFTSSVEQSDLVRCYELGCNSYIRKPVEYNQFQLTVQKVAAYWMGLNKLPGR